MSGERKRKLGENEQHMMALLKRLHLEHSSELYERPSLLKKSTPSLPTTRKKNTSSLPTSPKKNSHSLPSPTGTKRWRLSSILEEEEEVGVAAKRCKLDTEMADSLFNNLWISESKRVVEKDEVHPEEESVQEDQDLPEITLVGVRGSPRSLEQDFLAARLREQSLQVVLWTPPISVETIVQNGLHAARPGDSFQNEQGDSEFMC